MTQRSSTTDVTGLTPQQCASLLLEHRRRWLMPTLVCAVLAAGYALVMSRQWEASQALVVRREVGASKSTRPGKFADLYEMRTYQETILELVKSHQVIAATIKTVEKRATHEEPAEPTDSQVESFRRRLSMTPPGGAEFGKTEVFYFTVRDTRRDRAIQSVAELCRQLDQRLRQLREEQSQSLITELQQQVNLASEAHETETQKLTQYETNVGADLGELRMLNAALGGQSDLRQQAIGLEAESRQADLQVRDAEQLLVTLREAQLRAEQLVALPSSLLTSQPTLRQLKDGLVAAQLRTARLMGTRTSEHPQVQAAHDAVEGVRQELRAELQVAVQGVEVELGMSRNRSVNLEKQAADLRQRLSSLAELRARYANHVSAAENSRLVLNQASQQLGEVRAAQAAAHNVSLVSTIDQPETGPNPAGLGRASVVLMGSLGGLAMGLGWFFFTITPPTAPAQEDISEEPVAEQPRPVAELKMCEFSEIETPLPAVVPQRRSADILAMQMPSQPLATPTGISSSVADKIAEIMSASSRHAVPEVTTTQVPSSNGLFTQPQ